MEENVVVEENTVIEKKKNKKLLRLIIGLSLVCVSLTIGVVGGIKIASFTKVVDTPKTEEENQLQEIIDLLQESWYSEIYYGKDIDEDMLIHQFVGALDTSADTFLDPYTFLVENEHEPEVPETGKLGVTITNYYNYPVITEVIKGGPADLSGVKVGDIVVTLGKKDKNGNYEYNSIFDEDITFNNFISNSLGLPEETQYMKVARFDESNKLYYQELNVTLGKTLKTYYTSLKDENIDDTIMVKLTGFTSDKENKQGTADQLEAILKKDNSSNLIIDLRDNGGGGLTSAVDVCDLFLPKDKLVTILEYKDGSHDEYYTDDDTVYDYEKIIILQNGNTASASEVMIAALKYHLKDKVTLVGTKSYGKGIAQLHVPVLQGKYTLQYTCAKWFMPDDTWLGMTIDSNSDVGFKPEKENTIDSNYLVSVMNYYGTGLDYKQNVDNYIAYKLDSVANQNQYFFIIYNEMFNTNIRVDKYFDETCKQAIKDYQTLKGVTATGNMDLDTYLYFVKDFYDCKYEYTNSFVERAEEIIG